MIFDSLISNTVGKLADRLIGLIPNEEERVRLKLEIEEKRSEIEKEIRKSNTELMLAQVEVNKLEAGHSSLFVSGARPFILWVLGVGLAYGIVFHPLIAFVAVVVFEYSGQIPGVPTEVIMTLLPSLLGLSAFRTWEKTKGVATKSLSSKNNSIMKPIEG